VGAAYGLNFLVFEDDAPAPPPAAKTGAKPGQPPSPPPAQVKPPDASAPGPGRPSFDVVRINPQGDAVIAGRARPGSTVIILDGKTEIGRVKADKRGEWVFVPETPLKPGSRKLSLMMKFGDGAPVASDSDVVLVVPERSKDIAGAPSPGGDQVLALKVPKRGRGATPVLQRPGPAVKGLSVDAVDYDETGKLSITGSAPAGARVNLYLSGKFIGHARASEKGVWHLSPNHAVKPGLYRLRADQVDAAGKVTARVAIPFSRAATVAALKPGTFVTVQPGNSLWRLARRTYGEGLRYTVIYEANKKQIQDPDLIYPGQVFALPSKK